MISDEGFATAPVRLENRKKCVAELRAIFAAEDLAHSDKSFAGFEGVWDGMRTAREIDDDSQVIANGWRSHVTRPLLSIFSAPCVP